MMIINKFVLLLTVLVTISACTFFFVRPGTDAKLRTHKWLSSPNLLTSNSSLSGNAPLQILALVEKGASCSIEPKSAPTVYACTYAYCVNGRIFTNVNSFHWIAGKLMQIDEKTSHEKACKHKGLGDDLLAEQQRIAFSDGRVPIRIEN